MVRSPIMTRQHDVIPSGAPRAQRQPEREAERGAGDDIGGVVQPDVDAGRGDRGGERVPAGPPPSSVAAQNAAVACPDGNELVIGRCRPWRNSISA